MWQVTPKDPSTHDPTKSEWADYAVQAWCGNLSGNKLTRDLSGDIRPQSSQVPEPLWTDSGIKSAFSVRELISTGGESMVKHSPKILASEEKVTMNLKLVFLRGKSGVDALVHNIVIKSSS